MGLIQVEEWKQLLWLLPLLLDLLVSNLLVFYWILRLARSQTISVRISHRPYVDYLNVICRNYQMTMWARDMEGTRWKVLMISQVLVPVSHVNLVDLLVLLWVNRCDSLGRLKTEIRMLAASWLYPAQTNQLRKFYGVAIAGMQEIIRRMLSFRRTSVLVEKANVMFNGLWKQSLINSVTVLMLSLTILQIQVLVH